MYVLYIGIYLLWKNSIQIIFDFMVFFKTKFCRAGKPIDNSIEKHSTYHNSNA